MWLRSSSVAVALSLSLLPELGCGGGDDDDDIVVLGDEGTQVAATFPGWVPMIGAAANDKAGQLIVDTGAPITILDKDSFPDFEKEGQTVVDFAGFGLTFPDYTAVRYNLFGAKPGPGVPDGIVGGDLLRHFALRIDYQGKKAALYHLGDPPPPDAAIATAGSAVSFDLLGGGVFAVPGNCAPAPRCGTMTVHATRVLLKARFEGQTTPRWILLDTGASAVVVSETFLAELGDAGKRPRLDGVGITTATGPVTAALSRVSRLTIESATTATTPIVVDDLPMLVLPSNELWQSISKETGRDVVALVGGSLLRQFQTTIDFRARTLTLDHYLSQAHLPKDEYIGVGFTMGPDGANGWKVADVYAGTDAKAEGLVYGQVVEEIGGTPIDGLPASSIDALLDGYTLGQDVPVGVLVGETVVTKQVRVENLLPSYPPP